jgi:pyruvate, water dikinase
MTWLRQLDDLDVADCRAVGHKAYHLGRLKQQGLPVAAGWVLTAAAWHHSLGQLPWGTSSGDRLAPLAQGGFRPLQQTSQRWQRALQEIAAIAPSTIEWPDCSLGPGLEATAWMLRASVWVDPPRGAGPGSLRPRPWLGDGVLPAHIEADRLGLEQALPQFWSQALNARCLRVWMVHCQRLQDLSLATLIMPMYPALASGTIILSAEQTTITAVAGLGQALTRGEAIPARCHIPAGDVAAATWQPGFQERLHLLRSASRSPNHGDNAMAVDPIQHVRRDRPDLAAPLDTNQLAELVRLATTARLALDSPGVRLEWLLCPGPAPAPPRLVITQASPWLVAGKGIAFPATNQIPPPAPVVRNRPRPQPPLLPSASIVVRGIGASVGRIQGVAVVAKHPQDLPHPLPAGCVVVLPDLQPDVFLQLQAVSGIVTERGGATCHAAILAREVGIPAVVGAPQATELLENDMVLWLDGDRGVVYSFQAEALGQPPVQAALARFQAEAAATASGPLGAEHRTRYQGLKTRVMVNLSQNRRLADLPLDHIDGIGLLRSEWLLLDVLEGRHPWDWVNRGQEAELQYRLVKQLEPILQALGPKPLRYRSLDLRSHEWQALVGSPPVEPNPMLGLRGTLSYDVDDRLFQVELAALASLQRAGHTNLQLILPFVRTVEEVIACRQRIDQTSLTDSSDFALWIMAEVPSVLFLLPAYAQAGVQGIAIGSNDLTQLLLAADRDQPIIASAYDERHPVVRLALAHLVKEAQRCGLTCSICGQAPVRHPELIADLVAWGINSISVEAAALAFTLETVWQAEQLAP